MTAPDLDALEALAAASRAPPCPRPCSECDPGEHHFGEYVHDAEDYPDHPMAKATDLFHGPPCWYTCKHCEAWAIEPDFVDARGTL